MMFVTTLMMLFNFIHFFYVAFYFLEFLFFFFFVVEIIERLLSGTLKLAIYSNWKKRDIITLFSPVGNL